MIIWTPGAMWNPFRGCSKATAGCDHCWACRQERGRLKYLNLLGGRDFWDGPVRQPQREWEKPLHWKKPRIIAAGFRTDPFHKAIPFYDNSSPSINGTLNEVFCLMAAARHHTYILTTKRATRMLHFCKILENTSIKTALQKTLWLGASAHDQATADAALTALAELKRSGWHTWLSLEPMLGPVSVSHSLPVALPHLRLSGTISPEPLGRFVDAVVVGGESGRNARPMHPDWVRTIRDECAAAGVPFVFKQWGGKRGYYEKYWDDDPATGWPVLDGRIHNDLAWAKEDGT